jgi:ribonuclease-3
VLGLVVTEHLYQNNPHEHEGQLTKTKSLLVSKAILSRRALAMGLGRFVLMSHSEVESGGRQRLSILADAFEAVIGAIYLDQGYAAARAFIARWLLRDSRAILSDKRHTNYKSQLQEYAQSAFRTHPIYHIRSEVGPDHSKVFVVDVLVGRRVLGEGRGRNKKEAEQAAARDGLERLSPERERRPREAREGREGGGERRPRSDEAAPGASEMPAPAAASETTGEETEGRERRRRRRGVRGGRGRRERSEALRPPGGREASEPLEAPPTEEAADAGAPEQEVEAAPRFHEEEDYEEVGRPEVPFAERQVDPYAWEGPAGGAGPAAGERGASQQEASSPEPEEPGEWAGGPEEVPPEPAPGKPEARYGRRPPRGRGYRP